MDEIAEKLERIAKALEQIVDYGIHVYVVDDQEYEDDSSDDDSDEDKPGQQTHQQTHSQF